MVGTRISFRNPAPVANGTVNKNEYTRLAQQNEIDDLDDIVEDQCPSTRINVPSGTNGLSSEVLKAAKSRKKSVRNARKLKEKLREE